MIFYIFLKNDCHCERVQRVKQSAKHEQEPAFFSRKLYLGILLKLKKNRTRAWQIASLVALARNDSIFSRNFEHKYFILEIAEFSEF